eukprot:GFYU01003125.1.p1 GENE.GFYU01003125.1~~GFYU01003125.1.p1  ORF type:complete len:536 (-),score=105.47 GFYU01003125.1:254-1861(-)
MDAANVIGVSGVSGVVLVSAVMTVLMAYAATMTPLAAAVRLSSTHMSTATKEASASHTRSAGRSTHRLERLKKGFFDDIAGAVKEKAASALPIDEVQCTVCKLLAVAIRSKGSFDEEDPVLWLVQQCKDKVPEPAKALSSTICAEGTLRVKGDKLIDEIIDYHEEDDQAACQRSEFCPGQAPPRKLHKCPSLKPHQPCGGPAKGTCDFATGKCNCNQGFSGDNCSAKEQPPGPAPAPQQPRDAARNMGSPAPGESGSGSGTQTCPNACSGHGTCDMGKGQCSCSPEWTGSDCATQKCPNKCSGRGDCTCDGAGNCHCSCISGYEGPDCSQKSCPNGCSGHGTCNHDTSQCECQTQFMGNDCSQHKCPPYEPGKEQCSGHGTCDTQTGTCKCDYDATLIGAWTNPDCSVPPARSCPSVEGSSEPCSGHGHCDTTSGKCSCNQGYTNENCGQPIVPDDKPATPTSPAVLSDVAPATLPQNSVTAKEPGAVNGHPGATAAHAVHSRRHGCRNPPPDQAKHSGCSSGVQSGGPGAAPTL